MRAPSSNPPTSAEESRVVIAIVASLFLFAPLIKGGNDPIPLLVLELGSLFLWARILTWHRYWNHLPGFSVGILLTSSLLPLLYFIPIPLHLWGDLPGREHYLEIIEFVIGDQEILRQISILPFQSESGWYALFYPLSIFLITLRLSERKLNILIKLFIAMAVFQAVLGLIQFGMDADSPLRFGNPYYTHSAVGTYVNRNHLAALLYMALPLSLAVLTLSLRPNSRRGRKATATMNSAKFGRILFYGILSVTILVGLIFTRSRGGIALGMVALLFSALLFAPHLGNKSILRLVGTILFVGLVLIIEIGLAPVLARFASPDTIDNGRWDIFSAAFDAAQVFSPLGAGPSNFPGVFPFFQPGDLLGFINRAHNDYLELYFDGGILFLLPIVLLIGFYFVFWKNYFFNDGWGSFQFLQVSAGLSIFLILLHSFLDFNLHIPSNMGYLAFLAGIFFHPQVHHQRNKRVTIDEHQVIGSKESVHKRQIPDENKINPFDD